MSSTPSADAPDRLSLRPLHGKKRRRYLSAETGPSANEPQIYRVKVSVLMTHRISPTAKGKLNGVTMVLCKAAADAGIFYLHKVRRKRRTLTTVVTVQVNVEGNVYFPQRCLEAELVSESHIVPSLGVCRVAGLRKFKSLKRHFSRN